MMKYGKSMKGNQVEAVIFDWAGTTVDYGCFAPLAVFLELFDKFGVPITVEEARKPMGLMKSDHIRALCGMERIAVAWEARHGRQPGEADIDVLYGQLKRCCCLFCRAIPVRSRELCRCWTDCADLD